MTIRLGQIQGNIFGGFNKDFQDFLFVEVLDKTKARAWIKANCDQFISSSLAVLQFNNAFKALLKQGVAKPETVISARWANVAFSANGLHALGLTHADTGTLPPEFTGGMAARGAAIGDVLTSAPATWLPPFDTATRDSVHAVFLVAADAAADLADHITALTSGTFSQGFKILAQVQGRTRVDDVGHEHFGFKDGVSQPGIRGIDSPEDPLANPNQGHPGQDLLWPGEFVLGYPTQKPTQDPAFTDGPNPNPGTNSTAGKASWTDDGSFLVFRQLQQDVSKFHKQLGDLADSNGLTVDVMGAKIVGRYKSGCPIESLQMQPNASPISPTDPALARPELATSDSLNNAFEYGDDAVGARCPMAAHIRKAYPRDEETGFGKDSESETQTHRLLRRGIPYGASLGAAVGGAANDKRGLLFLAYQNDIKNHFEFVQQAWVNNKFFPPGTNTGPHVPGEDPLIAQSASGPFEVKPAAAAVTVSHFVTTVGGEYFFAPSLKTLKTF